MSEIFTGQIQNGVIVLDEGTPSIPEGTRLRIEPIPSTPSGRSRSLAERLSSVIGKAEGLPPDLADQHDHYLHGQPKR